MAGLAIDFNLRGDVRVSNKLRSAQAKLRNLSDLLNGVASLVESQHKRRVQDEKTTPDGRAWDPWSPEYAATRSSHHSLLIGHQDFLDSITGEAHGDTHVTVSSDRVYAGALHRDRPWRGLSQDNKDEILDVVDDWMRGVL